jgi:CHAT domain-containing protein
VVHLATHGYFNKLNPLLSRLELEPGGGDDGRLEVHEVLGLRVPADLITLSACETALGSGYFSEVPAGDDFVGLTRAFLFAGSASVLASLWEVNDRSTLEFMEVFYSQLQERGRAAALATAQRQMLHAGGRYAHPYFWVPFTLVGDMG